MKNAFVILLCLLSVKSFAQVADDELKAAAMSDAKQVLTNQAQRGEVIKNSPQARRADELATITAMGNKDYKEEMYKISSELLEWVGREQDPMKLVQKYQQDPAAFLRDMPADQAAKIKALANSIEQKRSGGRAPASVVQP